MGYGAVTRFGYIVQQKLKLVACRSGIVETILLTYACPIGQED